MTDGVFNSIDRKFPWSFLGFLAGISFGIFGIYTVFFYAKAPDLKVVVLSSAPVLSIRENVQELEIMFKGKNIRQSHQALTLMNIKLINLGNVPVRPGDFDEKDLLSLILKEGDIVKADVIETTDTYLKKVFAQTVIDSQNIRFPPFILEPSNFMSIRILVLHNETAEPILSMKGKIANVSEIPVIKPTIGALETTMASSAFTGDVVVQSVRVVSYGLGTLAFLAGVIWLFDIIQENIKKRRRHRHRLNVEIKVDRFIESLPDEDRNIFRQIARTYFRDDEMHFMLLYSFPRLIARLEGFNEELMKDDFELNEVFSHLFIDLPNFNRDYFFSDKDKMRRFLKMLEILVEFGAFK